MEPTKEFMINLLSKVQPLQREALEKGFAADIDTHISDFLQGEERNCIYVDFYILEADIHYEFHYLDTEEQSEAKLAMLRADINALQYV